MKENRKFLKGMLAGAAAMLLAVGFIWGIGSIMPKVITGQGKAQTSLLDDKKEVSQKLEKIGKWIDGYYLYGDKIDGDALVDGIYSGYAQALGDPYTEYYNEQETKELLETTSGKFFGVGAALTQNLTTGEVVIVSVYAESPAADAGLKEGDVLYRVDEHTIVDESLTEIVSWIKGKQGTEVDLYVRRDGEELKLTAVRDEIEAQTVEYEMKDGQIGYIAVSEFDEVTYEQFKGALQDLEEQGMQGLVIDLRSNPGGNMDTVTDMLKLILPEGTIVSTKDKYGNEEKITCDGEHKFTKPLAVLVNQYSASASEIFTGAVQDYKIGTIVGTTTYGKGVVQQLIDLEDGTYLKLTIAEYYTPSGRSINGTGITPDIEVEYEADAENPDADNQLEKALETVRSEIE
ncbi:S41 family peptidase [Mediterraneibacter sp. ICN-202921]|uniref:S41 family peptidase n=1 Tax=Mediterraneibacter sp. ICN-202921 TaxID=3134657 RepID=UPI0030C413DA